MLMVEAVITMVTMSTVGNINIRSILFAGWFVICIFSSFHFSRVILPISVEEVSDKCVIFCVCVFVRVCGVILHSGFIIHTDCKKNHRVMISLLVYKGLPLSFRIRSLSCMSVSCALFSSAGSESFHLVLLCVLCTHCKK